MYISQTLRRAVQLNCNGMTTVFVGCRQAWREFESRRRNLKSPGRTGVRSNRYSARTLG